MKYDLNPDPVVYVLPTELWQYMRENRKLIEENIVVIAEDKNCGLEVRAEIESGGFMISVYHEDCLIRDDMIISKEDAIITCRAIYERFLTSYGRNSAAETPQATDKGVEEDDEDDEDEPEEDEPEREDEAPDEEEIIIEMIDERESALSNALEDFLTVAIEEQADMVTPDELDEIMDEFLITLTQHGYFIYRPTMVEDDLIEYPYNESESDSGK